MKKETIAAMTKIITELEDLDVDQAILITGTLHEFFLKISEKGGKYKPKFDV